MGSLDIDCSLDDITLLLIVLGRITRWYRRTFCLLGLRYEGLRGEFLRLFGINFKLFKREGGRDKREKINE